MNKHLYLDTSATDHLTTGKKYNKNILYLCTNILNINNNLMRIILYIFHLLSPSVISNTIMPFVIK